MLMLISAVFARSIVETPNILLIIADDIGVDKVSSYAADDSSYAPSYLPETDTIDSLAAAGLRFTQAWANPLCSPTRAGLMVGQHAFRHGIGRVLPLAPQLDTSYTTLPELLSSTYATALFGKWHLGYDGDPADPLPEPDWAYFARRAGTSVRRLPTTANPLLHGYQHFDGILDGAVVDYWRWTELKADINEPNPITGDPVTQLWTESTYATTVTTERAVEWIQQQTGPWMATVSFNAPHNDESGWDADHTAEACSGMAFNPGATQIEAYQAMIQCLDDSIESLLAGIGDDELERTLIIFMGDNGTKGALSESVYAHTDADGIADRGKSTLYETGIRVPLILADGKSWLAYRDMGVATNGMVRIPGRTVTRPVHTTDLFATIGEIAGVDVSSGTDSVSMVPYMDSPAAPAQRDHVFTETFNEESSGAITGMAAYREASLKLIIGVVEDGKGSTCQLMEMYDLAADPYEVDNLASGPEHLSDLAELTSHLTRVDDGAVPAWLDVPSCTGG